MKELIRVRVQYASRQQCCKTHKRPLPFFYLYRRLKGVRCLRNVGVYLSTWRNLSELVQQCQKALNYISTRYALGLYWVPGHAGARGNEFADELARHGSDLRFVGPEPALGISRQEYKRD